jgi:putative ATP-dependent DNA ligase
MNFVAKALNLNPLAAKRLEERKILRKAFIPHPFFSDIIDAFKLDKKFGEFEEGTVIAKTTSGLEVVRGYPKIRRALTLYPTIKKHFEGEVVIEEKMNGYNARIVLLGRRIYAITRRGFFCPYTTEKAREMINDSFFKDHPELMLCCEAVGSESPFVVKEVYGKGIDFFIFDVRERRTNIPLPIRFKERASIEYGFKIAPIIEVCEKNVAHLKCKEIVRELGKKGREGVVIKDPEMKLPPIKYTASESNVSDLSYAFKFFYDYGKDFMLSRIVREGFQSFEFEESEAELEERAKRLGMAILKSMIGSIQDVSNGKKVVEKHKLRFRSKEVLELFKEQLKRMGVEAEFYEPYMEDGNHVLEFDRIMVSTHDKIRSLLDGSLW